MKNFLKNAIKAIRSDVFGNIVIPFAYLAITLMVDYTMPYSTITPLMGISGLMVFSFRLKPSWMVFWAFVYALVVACIFLYPGFYGVMNSSRPVTDPVTPWLRTATFVLGAILSSVLCMTMARLTGSEKSLKELIGKLPIPVLTSDINGDILYANPAAQQLMGSVGELSGKNYFEIFPREGKQGALIAQYLRKFSRHHDGAPLELCLDGKTRFGNTHLLEGSRRSILLTILDDAGHGTNQSTHNLP